MKRQHGAAALLSSCAFLLSFAAEADVGFYLGVEAGQGRTELGAEDDDLVATRGVLLDSSSDREDTTFGVYGGYTFSGHFAIELGYTDLGATSYTMTREVPPPFPFPFPLPFPLTEWSGFGVPSARLGGTLFAGVALPLETQKITLDSEALSLAIVGRYELAAGFALLGRAGLAVHRTESSIEFWFNGAPARVIGGESKASSGAAVLGVGGEWAFHPNWAARLQAQRHLLLEEQEIYPVDRGDVTTVAMGIEYRF